MIQFLPTSVADPDPGSGAFLTPESGIPKRFFPDPGSRIPNPYFWELIDNFLGKKFYNSLKIGPNYFLRHFKNKIIFNFVKFVATKNDMTTNFFCCFWIRDPGWVKIRIRDLAGINIPDPQHFCRLLNLLGRRFSVELKRKNVLDIGILTDFT